MPAVWNAHMAGMLFFKPIHMFSKIRLLLVLVGCHALSLHAAVTKDTVRIFQYNLLTYGDANNPVSYKNPRLASIVTYANPDIIGVNELSNGASYAQSVLTGVLGNGWTKGNYSNVNNQIQTNMLFWKTDKFALAKQTLVASIVRDIIAFRLYYKDAALATTRDTTFITVIVGHLKAGEASSDSITRSDETRAVANFLNNQGSGGNYVFMGDFNLYSSGEQAYQNLVNNSNQNGRLYDPISSPGYWHSNSNFASIHTQSTRTTNLPDGGVSGGLDDRFDHILISGYLMNNTAGVQYLPGSYQAIGQDGHHLNKAVNAAPTNTAVPAAIATALYEMSDHLPVTAAFVITKTQPTSSIATTAHTLEAQISMQNPVAGNLRIRFDAQLQGKTFSLAFYNANGQLVKTGQIVASGGVQELLMNEQVPGIYTLQVSDANGNKVYRKLMVY